MFKKIMFGAVLFGLFALLGIGAVIRTMDRTSTYRSGYGQGRGWTSDSPALVGGSNQTQPYQGQDQSPRWGQQTQQLAVSKITGSVVSVDENAMTVQAVDGSQVTVENRPWWFAQEQQFVAKIGDQIDLVGFAYNGTFETSRIENITSGKTAQLRDEFGRPGWSGRGQRGS